MKSGISRSKLLLAPLILLRSKKKKRRTEIRMSVKSNIITVTKKAIIQISAPSQNNSVDLGNLRACD